VHIQVYPRLSVCQAGFFKNNDDPESYTKPCKPDTTQIWLKQVGIVETPSFLKGVKIIDTPIITKRPIDAETGKLTHSILAGVN
jgi:hypothetical protein